MKTTLEGINSRLGDTEEHISSLEDWIVEIINSEQKINKLNEDSLRDLRDNIKYTNIHIIGVPEGEEREILDENIFAKIMTKTSLTWRRK